MDDIPLPGLDPDPNPVEPSAEFPQLPTEEPILPSEPSLPEEPPSLPENPPIPSGDPPPPIEAPSNPPEEAPVPVDGLVSFFQESNLPTADDMNCDEPVEGPQLDPDSVSPFVSSFNSTDQPLTAAASVDGASSVFGENDPLQNIQPNASAPVADVEPQPPLDEMQPAEPPIDDPPTTRIPNAEVAAVLAAPSASVEAYPVHYADSGVDPQQVVTDPAQVQYSASYMGYPQMSDPSMMNYSYMANSYTDYMSMYHTGRMSRYPNTYASYQGYNYSYPHMQQMYDGRNMAAYSTGSYPQQMLPGSTTSMISNFTPPLPTDYKAPSFSTEPPQAKKPPAKPNVNALAESDLPPLPEGAMPEQPKERVEAPPKIEVAEKSAQPSTEVPDDDGSDRMITDQDEPSDNFSEDVNRYSPSLPMDEDEANHQSSGVDDNASNRSASKSSVLGKAQAKKRLMAFSISKQAAAAQIAAKKQAQTTGRDKKENGEPSGKPGSDEVSVLSNENVFDDKHSKKRPKKSSKMEKARETIEEIEEIKRNEMSTMMYRQNLLNDSTNDHSSDRRRDRNRRRSRSYSRSRSRRRSRSRSHDRKSRRSDKKYRRRSRSRSRSKSGSRSRSPSQADKKTSVKPCDIKSWDDFVEAGFQLARYRGFRKNENKNSLASEIESRKKEASKHGRYREKRSTSIEKEVIEEYRKRKIHLFEAPSERKIPFVFRLDKHAEKEFSSHIMQYTENKPTIKFCENPKYSTLHLINRVQLLESVPDDVALMIKNFWSTIRPKRMKEKLVHQREDGERSPSVDEAGSKCPIRWWSSDPLHEDGDKYIAEDEIEEDDEEIIPFMPFSETSVEVTTSAEKPTPKLAEKPVSVGVRKSRFEDATEEKPGVNVVVRSRWDSDYEDSPKNTNNVDLSVGMENVYHESPKVDSQVSKLNSEGPALPPMEDPYQTKSVAAVPPEETSTSTFVNKKHVLIERRPKKNKDKSKRGSKDFRESSEPKKSRKSKSSLSPDEWREETDGEPVDVPPPKEPKKVVREEYAEDPFEKNKSGEHKLVSEYEEFMKSVSLEQPKSENLPLYEGPKPPPQQEGPKPPTKPEKLNDVEDTMNKSIIRDTNPSPSNDTKMEVNDDEEVFDIDKFFLKEKKMRKLAENEQNKKKDDLVSEPNKKTDDCVTEIIKKTDDLVESDGEMESDMEAKRKKKRDKKEKPKKKKIAVKVKKLSAKNKKKQREKKKKYASSSDSSDSSDESDSDDSNSSDDSASSDSSSTSSSNSSSSDHSSSDSTSNKKRKRTKKVKKKDKKPERKASDKSKKKKKKQKMKETETDSKKKKKKGSKSDDKKKKSKKLPTENFLELLAVSLKNNESEENDVPKKMVKEKRKKRKKKSERDKDDKVANSLLDVMPTEISREFSEEKILAKMKELEKASPLDSKKKKKKTKKKRSPSVSEEERPSWKKKKLIDPREIEESVAKAQMNPFFDGNLDDWDRLAAPSAAEHSMRDNSKNELEIKDAKKKKKPSSTKQKVSKHGSDKPIEKEREEKQKNKPAHKKKKKPASKKLKKKDDKKTFLDKENKKPLSPGDSDVRPTSTEPNFDKESPQLSKDLDTDLDRSLQSPDHTPAYKLAECETSKLDNAAQQSEIQPPSASADRYSPTFCDEDNGFSPAKRETYPECLPVSAAPNYYNFQTSSLYACFAPTDLQNISLPTAVPKPVPAPLPVPPPSIQPSHSFASSAMKDSSLVSARESVVSSSCSFVSAAEPSVAASYSVTTSTNMDLSPSTITASTSDNDNDPNAFSKVVVTELDKGSYKSFSVGKLEVKTKAAKKFVHSNIFDSFESEEQHSKPEPLTPTTTVAESVESVDEPIASAEPPNIPEDEVEKEEFQARPCIALPELPAVQREVTPAPASAADRSPHSESTPLKRDTQVESSRHHSSTEKRSRSRDRNSRRRTDRDRESSHRDSHRRRSRTRTRSRSRSRSHSRSYDRHRKRHFRGRDRYKRNHPRDRSRSRSRRRSRDRDFKDHRYRQKRRSYSREPKKSSRRERTPPEAEPPSRNTSYEEQPPLPPMMAQDERMRIEANYDADYERHYSEIRARDSVTELSRRLHESQYHNADLKPADINAFQAILYELRETMMNVNCKERHVDSINAIIAKLEARKMEAAVPALAPGDPRACNNPQTQHFIQSMLSLCHQIQSSLPAAAAPPMEAKPRAVGPRSPPDPYHSPQAKKSVADSTNGSYPPQTAAGAVNSRFEERSREISPKPLSLDERLELELGVKRTTPTAKKPPGLLPPGPNRAVMGMPPRGFYAMPPMYENGVPNFSQPPPPLHFASRMNAAPAAGLDRNYYAGVRQPLPINWPAATGVPGPPPFLGPQMPKIQPPVMLPPPGMPPRAMPPLPSESKVPYRVPDPVGSKVHSIQVGNVLQIVPTELQPSSVSSQGAPKQLPLPPQAPATSTVGLPATTYVQQANSVLPAAATFSSLLSTHLPISFAAAPAVSGSKAKTPTNSRPTELPSSNEPRLANETKTKIREAHQTAAPPIVTPPPIGSSGSKISKLPFPPGTTEADMRKLVRMAREKRLLKLRAVNDSPATPTSDDSSLVEDQEITDEPLAPISIKPSPEQGILISPGFKEKSTPVTALGRSIIGSSRKMVSFVDGVRPGAPTVSDSPPTKVRKPSPPPKKKHKVRVKIIRPEDSSDDDDSPPPPPPGPPPPELYPPTGIAAIGLQLPGFILPKL